MRHLVPFLGNRSVQLFFSRHYSTSFVTEIQKQRLAGRLRGQNLTERYVRLAKSLKGKEHYTGGFDVPSTSTIYDHPVLKSDPEMTFHGFVIPQAPQEPSSEGKRSIIKLRIEIFTDHSQTAACQDALFAFTISMNNH